MYCGSLASVRSSKPAFRIAFLLRRCTALFSGPALPQPTCSEEFTPFSVAASAMELCSHRPGPSKRNCLLFSDVERKIKGIQTTHIYECSYSSTNDVVSAYGGRALEMLRHLCAAAHLRPCAALSQHVRIGCLLHRQRSTALFFWIQSASTVLRARANHLSVLQKRFCCCRLDFWKTASSDHRSDSLFSRYASCPSQWCPDSGKQSTT